MLLSRRSLAIGVGCRRVARCSRVVGGAAPATCPAQSRLRRRRARCARAATGLPGARGRAHLLRDARPLRERRPGERPRGSERRQVGDGLRLHGHRLVPRRRPEGADRCVHRHENGARAREESRLHRRLARARRRPADGAGRQRRLPRVLGARLHAGRPAPRDECRLRGLRRLRAQPRAEGLPRHRRQPHGGRHPALRRDELPRAGGDAVPRLQGQAVLGAALCGRQAVSVSLRPLPAAPGDRAAGEA